MEDNEKVEEAVQKLLVVDLLEVLKKVGAAVEVKCSSTVLET
jgi:hypothetical protein